MTDTVRPIFLFSLPRSGSTLTQRILAKHPEIETAAEPWLLLSFLSGLQDQGIYTRYDHSAAVEALRDFNNGLPEGQETFLREVAECTRRLYQARSRPGARYFLDKTPRYHLIADEILRMFPEARFVFLWRNPLSIIASMLDTWHRGHWYLYFFKVDLYTGFANLFETMLRYEDRVFSLQYEALLDRPEETCRALCAYLDVPYYQEMIETFSSVTLDGEMGDPTGVAQYKAISSKPLEKWKASLTNPIRKSWCRSYVTWLGKDRLAQLGYDQDELFAAIDALPFSLRRVGGDLARGTYGFFYQMLEFRMLSEKLRKLPTLRDIYPHM